MIEIVTPAANTDLTTMAAVKAELGITDGASDAVITGCVTDASAAVVSIIGRALARETIRETLRGEARSTGLVLARYPVSTVSSVIENGTALAAQEYELNGRTGVLTRLYNDAATRWPSGKIVVEYAAGYILPDSAQRDLPQDIERAAVMIAAGAYRGRSRDPLLKVERVDAVASREYFYQASGGYSPEVMALLAPYADRVI